MSAVRRWTMDREVYGRADSNGYWVTYADHVAAVAAAVQRIRSDAGVIQAAHDIGQRGYEQGQRDERARIRAGLIALNWDINTGMDFGLSDALAVIDAAPQDEAAGKVATDRQGADLGTQLSDAEYDSLVDQAFGYEQQPEDAEIEEATP